MKIRATLAEIVAVGQNGDRQQISQKAAKSIACHRFAAYT